MKAVAALLLVLCPLAHSHAWTCGVGPEMKSASQVDAGLGMVVIRDVNSSAYFLMEKWYKMSEVKLQHVSVGPAGIWASGLDKEVYKFVGGDFKKSCGQSMKQVDAGGYGVVVGVSIANDPQCLKSGIAVAYSGTDSLDWSSPPGDMTYISCGPQSCWAIDRQERIYFTTIIAATCESNNWSQISGAATIVEVGTDGTVFVRNRGGDVYQRMGISGQYLQGTSWTRISMPEKIRHLSYDLNTLWVVAESGSVLKCTQ